MGSVAMVEREEGSGRGVGMVVDAGGKIAAVGYDSEIDAMMQGGRGRGVRFTPIRNFMYRLHLWPRDRRQWTVRDPRTSGCPHSSSLGG